MPNANEVVASITQYIYHSGEIVVEREKKKVPNNSTMEKQSKPTTAGLYKERHRDTSVDMEEL